MSAKVILVFCAQALFVQLTISTCAGHPNLGVEIVSCSLSIPIAPRLGLSSCAGPILPAPIVPTPGCSSIGYNGIGYGNAGLGYGPDLGYGSNLAIEVIPTSGGAFPLSISSTVSNPIGLSITSENVFEGTLYVCGELPFTSAVALEGELPCSGAGAISHNCDNGVTTIESIAPSAAGAVVPAHGSGLGAYGAATVLAPLYLLPGAGYNALLAENVAPSVAANTDLYIGMIEC